MKKYAVANCTLIMIVVFLILYLLVSLTPLFADDFTYYYSFEQGFDSPARNKTITDVQSLVRSQIGHYHFMNGRIVAHSLAQIFLVLDKNVFNITSSVAFVLLGLLICFHGNGEVRSIRPFHLILTYASLFLMAPSFGQSYLWLTGSCNYLFTFVIVLVFLIPYRQSFYASEKSGWLSSVIAGIFMAFAGITAGNTNENTGVSLAVMLIVYLVCYFLKFRKVRFWMLMGCIGVIAGCAICILSPGNAIRNGGTGVRFSLGNFIKYSIFFSAQMFQSFAPLLVSLAFMSAHIYTIQRRKGKNNMEILIDSVKENFFLYFYFVFFLGSVYAMAVPAQFPARAWSHSLALLIIVTLSVLNSFIKSIEFNPKEYRRYTVAASVILIAIAATVYLSEYPKVNASAFAHAQRVQQIEEAKANGEKEVSVCSIVSTSRYVCHDYQGDISENSDYWINQGMAKFYGIDLIKKECDYVI